MWRAITGRYGSPAHVVRFGLGGLVLAVLLFVAAAALYPPENGYAILRKSASYLGSFDANRNPTGWWLFSVGLFAMGAVAVGAALSRHRHLARHIDARWSLRLATGAFLVGGVIFFLLGAIPDARSAYLGPWDFNDVHDTLAGITFWCLGIGMLSDVMVLWGDARAHGRKHFDYGRLKRPYIAFLVIGLIAGGALGTWAIKCQLDSSLKPWPGEGIYAFPMWEWILMFLGPVLLVWIAYELARMRA